jgi:hypothetical protein
MRGKVLAAVGAVALAVSSVAAQSIDWGTGYNSFRDTCAAIGGDLYGNPNSGGTGGGYGSACVYGGGVVNVPGGSNGWTVDVAYGTIATWLGGSNVVEETTGDGIVIACYNPGGQSMKLSHQHCVPQ